MACEGSDDINCQKKLFAVNNIIAKPELQFRWQWSKEKLQKHKFYPCTLCCGSFKDSWSFSASFNFWMAYLI